MKDYIICEYLKIRKRHFELLAILIPIVCFWLARSISKRIYSAGTINAELGALTYSFAVNIFFTLGLPILIIIFLVMYCYIESADGGWKLLKISGGNIQKMVISKLIVSYTFLILVYVLYFLTTFIADKVWKFNISYSNFFQQFFISLLGAILNCTFLFLIFHSIKSIVMNVLIGIIEVVVNNVVLQTKYWKYIFTTYYYAVTTAQDTLQSRILLVCILGIVLLIGLTIVMSNYFTEYSKNE